VSYLEVWNKIKEEEEKGGVAGLIDEEKSYEWKGKTYLFLN